MNIGIIGGGSIGLLISGYLARHHRVTLYVKKEQQKKLIESRQLHLFQSSVPLDKVSISVELSSNLNREDCYIICVKQSEIDQIMPLLEEVDISTPLLFLQNGMGHIDKIKRLTNPVYVGVVEHGASRIDDNRVNLLGLGSIKLASFTGQHQQLSDLVEKLHDKDFPFEIKNDWDMLLKEKLIINAVINPLTALFNVKNGSVANNESIRHLARQLCDETSDVLKLNKNLSWERVIHTATNTGENTSSMLADIINNRKTEIEAISGYLLNNSTEQLPYTLFVYYSILGIEKERENGL